MKKSIAESIVGSLLEDGAQIDWSERLRKLRIRRGENTATGRIAIGDNQDLPIALPVVLRDRVIKGGLMICPHCEQDIHEKGLGDQDGKTVHRACGGLVELPPPSAEDIAYFAQNWGPIDQDTGRRPPEPTTLRA